MADTEIVDYEKLRALVTAELPKFKSARAVSLEATGGKNPDLVRNLLAGTNPQLAGVVGICTAMKIPLGAVMGRLEADVALPSTSDDDGAWLTINGEVEAGVFRAQPEWSPEDWYQVELEPINDGHRHHGLIVRGRSMDRIFPPGTILRIIDALEIGYTIGQDDYVIVEQRRGDLVEVTCKKVSLRPDGNYELIAESFLEQYQEPIFIGRPVMEGDGASFDNMDADETRVRAVVVDAHLPIRRRRTRPVPKR